MSPRDSIHIDEVPSDRWALALDGLRSGESACYFDEDVVVRLSRWNRGPRDDGRIHVEVFATQEYPSLSQRVAAHDVACGRDILRRVLDADDALPGLLAEYGVSYDYIWDYGNGAVAIANFTDDGKIRWLDDHGPSQ